MAVCFRSFPPRDVTLALLGLDNSGKSTLLANLTGGTLYNRITFSVLQSRICQDDYLSLLSVYMLMKSAIQSTMKHFLVT